jgi:hypothetical protein
MTNVPITAGTKVVMFITKGTYGYAETVNMKFLPVFGEYDDYGSIENVEDTFSFRYLKKQYDRDDFLQNDHFLNHEFQSMVLRAAWDKFSIMPRGDARKMMEIQAKVENPATFVLNLPRTEYRALVEEYKDSEIDWNQLITKLNYHVQVRSKEEQAWYKENEYKVSCPNIEMWLSRHKDLYHYPMEDYFEDVCRYHVFMHNMYATRRTFNNVYLGCQHEEINKHLELNLLTRDLLLERLKFMRENGFDW